jgi:transcriptional adapter 2-beta
MLCLIAEAKEEYIARYIGGTIGRLTWPAAASSRPSLSDQTNPDCGPLSPALTARLPPLDVTPDEAALLGYMPHRDDFERVNLCILKNLVTRHL